MLSCTGTARKRSLDHLDGTRKRIGQGKAAIGEVIKQSRSKPVSRKAWLLDVGGRNPARHRLSPLEGDGFEPSAPRSPVAPACEGAGAVQPDFFWSASHSIEPGAYTVLVGCGLARCAAASAFRRYNSNIPSLFIGSTSNSLNAHTKASTD